MISKAFCCEVDFNYRVYSRVQYLFPYNGWWVVPLKVAFDQTIWSAIWNSIYYVTLGLLRLESPARIWKDLTATFFPLLTVRFSELRLWRWQVLLSWSYQLCKQHSDSGGFYSLANIFPLCVPMQAGWKLWPFAHLVTYGLVPVEQRLLWVDCVEIVWVTILSM